jgi:4-hydroxy-tetrahydrodipicolinate synthase
LKRLSEIDYVIGVKEASGNISQMAQVVQQVPSDFAVLCGDDSITIPLIALGGHGVVSVVSNEIPREFTKLTKLALANDFAGARKLQRQYLPLMEVNFVESNPIPMKAAMALMGLLEPVWRLPLCPPSAANLAKIEKVVEALGLLTGRSVHAG